MYPFFIIVVTVNKNYKLKFFIINFKVQFLSPIPNYIIFYLLRIIQTVYVIHTFL